MGLIARPRLWWTRVDWSRIRSSPITGDRLKWTRTQKFYRLHQDGPNRTSPSWTWMACNSTPRSERGGQSSMPSPTGETRTEKDEEQKARWMNDGQTFALWQYSEEAMLVDQNGQLHVPPAGAKEQFHQLPKGYTKVEGVSERARHQVLANGWHLGSARFMMMLVLQMITTAASSNPMPLPKTSAVQTHGTAVGQVPANTGTGQMADGTHMRSARNIHVEPLGHGTQCGAPIVQTPNH